MTRAAIIALASHWRRHPGLFAALVLGLVLATALWSGVQAINAEARAAYDRSEQVLARGQFARLFRADGGPIAISDYVDLRRQGFLVSPVIETRWNDLTLLGIDPLTAPAGSLPPEILAATTDFADFADTSDNGGLVFFSSESAAQRLPRAIPNAALPPGSALADIATVARLTGETRPSYLLVSPTQPHGLDALAATTGLELRRPDTAADPAELTASFHLNLTAFGLLSFGVGLFIAHSAIGLAFEQRRPILRTLRALGLPLRRLIAVLAAELLGIAVMSGAIGIAFGYMIAAALLPGVAGTLRGLYGAPVAGELGFDPVWALWALVITLFGAALAGGSALWRVARMPILTPALPRAWAMDHRGRLRVQAVCAGGLLALAAGLTLAGSGLLVAFLALAALLLGAALLLPALLSTALGLLQPMARGPMAEWFLADTRQQIPGLSLALMALLLALSANIGVGAMVGSFRDTFTTWLEQRLMADLYVRATDGDQVAQIRSVLGPEATAILPVASVDRPILSQPGEVQGLTDHAAYRSNWPLLHRTAGAWDRLHDGSALFVSEQLARHGNLGLGDMVPVTPEVSLPIAAIYADYGNPRMQVTLGLDRFAQAFPDTPLFGFAVLLPDGTVPGAMAALRDVGIPESQMTDQRGLKAISIDIFEQTFRITDALAALTLGVAGIALLLGFLTLAQLRLPQLAPIWALGQTRNRLAVTETVRSIALAALTFLVALPVGLALAWLLLNRVNTEAFGWRLPMLLFPADWLRLGGLAALAAVLAALWPALQLARIAPLRLLQVFAHDR